MSKWKEKLTFDAPHGDAVVVPPGGSQSWWQPQPANGFAEVILSPRNIKTVHPFSCGLQTLPPGGRVRLHAHDRSEEVLFVLEGEGTAVVDGKASPMTRHMTLFLGHNKTHTFENTGSIDMKWVWFFMPGGLEDFFEGIGRPRQAGEPAPQPFARPENVREFENATVFSSNLTAGA